MEKITLTRKLLEAGISDNGGYSYDQTKALGVRQHKNSGWKKQLIGKVVSKKKYNAFLALKNKHLKKKEQMLFIYAHRIKWKTQLSCPFNSYDEMEELKCNVNDNEDCDLETCLLKQKKRIIVDWSE